MLLDRSKEEIARDLMEQAARTWGAERAEALRSQIDDTAESLSLIGRHALAIDGEEPDFLVAPAVRWEGK